MQAATLKKKKSTVSKGKIKKTIKNVICRPDPVVWPAATEDEALKLQNCLNNHRINIPEFKKLPWKDLKLIPKNERPKPPPIKKIDGLIFGVSECRIAVQNKTCSSLMVDAAINPQTIVLPLIETCLKINIPVVCLQDLRILCEKYFGIPTSCLGIKLHCLLDVSTHISEISQKKVGTNIVLEKNNISNSELSSKDVDNVSECIKDNIPAHNSNMSNIEQLCPYLYRSNKKSRVFIPEDVSSKVIINNKFEGQNYIKLSEDNSETKLRSKAYMKMILKKITNNPNRTKVK